MFTSAEEAAAAASRELIVLREQCERNRSALASVAHEISMLRSRQAAEQAAGEEFLDQTRGEIDTTLRSLHRLERMSDGPTVPAAELAKARELLDAKRQELMIAKREVTLLEGVIKIHADTPGLRLREQLRSLFPEIEKIALGGPAGTDTSSNDAAAAQYLAGGGDMLGDDI